MRYDLTLADLSIPDTMVGVCLRLHECREVLVTSQMTASSSFTAYPSFAAYVGMGKIAGIARIGMEKSEPPTIPTKKMIMADAHAHDLSPSDPMYATAHDYDEHQHMREIVRLTLSKVTPPDRQEIEAMMAALSIWLALHDPIHANVLRQHTLTSFQQHKRALFTIACTKNRAYIWHVGPLPIDTDKALQAAEHSSEPGVILQPRDPRARRP